MAFLIPDKTYEIKAGKETRSVKVKIIPDGAVASKDIASYIKKGESVKPNRPLSDGTGKPRGITVHNTNDITVAKGTNPAEQYARATYPNGNMNGVVVHYWVWENEIWQQLSDSEQGWHSADGKTRKAAYIDGKTVGGNVDTIAIEIIQSSRNTKTEETAAILIAYLLDKHGLSPDTGVYTHNYFYPKKYCPEVLLPVWNEFFARIKKYYAAIKSPESEKQPETPSVPAKKEISVGDTVKFAGGSVYVSSDAAKPSGKAEASLARVTNENKNGKHRYHLRAVDKNGAFISGVYGWTDSSAVSFSAFSAPSSSENKETKPGATAKIATGSVVFIKSSASNYYPGGVKIPSWVKTDYYYEISQTTYRGAKVYRGGKECVLLGAKINRKTGKKSGSIDTWISKDLISPK